MDTKHWCRGQIKRTLAFDLPGLRLAPGKYTLDIALSDDKAMGNYLWDTLSTLTIEPTPLLDQRYGFWIGECNPTLVAA